MKRCEGSDEQTANAQIVTGAYVITSLMVYTDGANDVTVILYDNTAGSGKVVGKYICKGADFSGGRIWGDNPVICHTGVYATITGANGSYIVEYRKR